MEGRQGLVRTVPDGFESGSDVATISLLGYDPAVYHTGRAPLEAAAQQIPLSPTDWVFRCNLVTTIDGVMKDHSAGGISNAEAQRLLAIYSVRRDVWRIRVDMAGLDYRADGGTGEPFAMQIGLGRTVSLFVERFLNPARAFVVIGRTEDCVADRILFDLWG